MLPRQLPPQLAPHAIDRAAEDGAVRTGEVDELEDAALGAFFRQGGELIDLVSLDTDHFPGLQLAFRRRADDVEGAGLGRDDPALPDTPEPERSKATRVHDRIQGATHGDNERVRTFH